MAVLRFLFSYSVGIFFSIHLEDDLQILGTLWIHLLALFGKIKSFEGRDLISLLTEEGIHGFHYILVRVSRVEKELLERGIFLARSSHKKDKALVTCS